MKALLVVLGIFPMLAAGCSGAKPANLGVVEGVLASCPSSPNCVSTQSKDVKHRMEPLTYDTTPERAKERLLHIVESMPRAKVVTVDGNYIHAEFTSRLFRFVDDVEFLIDDADKGIHFRSASRVGYSDLGVNRKRMEEIRKRFEAD